MAALLETPDAPDDPDHLLRGLLTVSSALVAPRRAPGNERRLAVPRHPLLDVVGHDLEVPLVTGGTRRHAGLDNAATTPALLSVAGHVQEVLPWYGSVHRGGGWVSRVASELYERARAGVADFVGAGDDDVVVLTRNTTDALNLLAAAAPDGTVVFLDLEHHANLLPWQARAHRRVPVAATVEETLDRLDRALIESPAVLLAITGASNVTGEVVPLDEVVRLAHGHRVRVAVDAAQLAPHRRLDMAATGIDYVALSGHKLYAPYGTGALVGRRDWLDEAEPHLLGGGGVEEAAYGELRFAPSPARHEAGSPNLLGAVALAAACRALGELPADALRYHEGALVAHAEELLGRVPGVSLHRLWPDHGERVGAVAFTVDGFPAGLVSAYLAAEHGVAVRDGRFCAHQLMDRLGLRAGAVRASVGLGSVGEDVDRLAAGVRELVAHGPRWRYRATDPAAGEASPWLPVDDPRRLPPELVDDGGV